MDLRRDVAFKDTNTCAVTPEKGNQGVPTSLIITPGLPLQSVVILRMTAIPDDANGKHGRMPKIASYVVDQPAVRSDQRLDHRDHELPAVALNCTARRAES